MSFKLFDVSAFEVTPLPPAEVPSTGPREPPKRRHIMIVDRGYFGFLEELGIILKSLKSCLLLASHVDKYDAVKGDLLSIAMTIFENNDDGLQTVMASTKITPFTLPEVLATIDRLLDKDANNAGDPSNGTVSWDRLMTSLAPLLKFPPDETCQITFFSRNWSLDFGSLPALDGRIDRFISVSLDTGNQFVEENLFGSSFFKTHKRNESILVLEMGISAFGTGPDVFFKRYVFQGLLAGPPQQVNIYLPCAVYGRSPVVIACEAYPRIMPSAIFPELQLLPEIVQANPRSLADAYASRTNHKVRLESVSLVKLSGICESVIFGNQSFILVPRLTMSLSTDDVQGNKQRFQFLSQQLTTDNVGLIVKARSQELHNIDDAALFLITAAQSGKFLLKSIATSEILLPFPFRSQLSGTGDAGGEVAAIEVAFDALSQVDYFDPFDLDSRLVSSLENQFRKVKPSTSAKVAKRS